jgi:hypothetical protein
VAGESYTVKSGEFLPSMEAIIVIPVAIINPVTGSGAVIGSPWSTKSTPLADADPQQPTEKPVA